MNNVTWYKRILFSICTMCRPHQRGPVRRFFSLGLMAALLSAGTFALLQQNSTQNIISITSDSSTVVVGEPFFIDVKVTTALDINAVEIDINYPENRLRIDNLRDGESVLSIWTQDPVAKNGRVLLRGGTFRRGFSGVHRIIRMRGTALRPGNIELTFGESVLIRGDGAGSRVSGRNISFESLSIRAVSRDDPLAQELFDQSRTPDTASLKTDLTGDGRVTMVDISIFLDAWSRRDRLFDFSGDGLMTFRDFSIILADYHRFR